MMDWPLFIGSCSALGALLLLRSIERMKPPPPLPDPRCDLIAHGEPVQSWDVGEGQARFQ